MDNILKEAQDTIHQTLAVRQKTLYIEKDTHKTVDVDVDIGIDIDVEMEIDIDIDIDIGARIHNYIHRHSHRHKWASQRQNTGKS